jgi:hypothetical protein
VADSKVVASRAADRNKKSPLQLEYPSPASAGLLF